MKSLVLVSLLSFLFGNVQCQSKGYKLSSELIKKKNNQLYKKEQINNVHPVGRCKNQIAFVGSDRSETLHFFLYDEASNKMVVDTIEVNQRENKIVRVQRQDGLTFLTGYLKVGPKFEQYSISNLPINSHGYQHLWIQSGNKEFKIDSLPYHFIDKYYECKFSDDARYLICNPYTSMTTSYSHQEDGAIFLYDLLDIDKGKVKKKIVECELCMHTFIFGETAFFQKENPIGNGFDGDYHNIYKAQIGNIADTTLLAFNIELLLVSPDQRYILGGQYLYGRYCPVIVDLLQQKFQYILGREYLLDRCFYSIQEQKFAFDFDDYVIYINNPKIFPFNALKNVARYTSKEENQAFWEKYAHADIR